MKKENKKSSRKKSAPLVERSARSEKIFPHLVNNAAFIDRVVVSLKSKLDRDFRENQLTDYTVQPIFKEEGMYSQCVYGVCRLTRNPVSVLYGRVMNFPNVPEARFTMHSESIPVTGSHVVCFAKSCSEDYNEDEVTVSEVEVTFDFTGASFQEVRNQIIHRARKNRELKDDDGRRTRYIGSRTSSWQVRIYQKTEKVLRLEFILRKPFLTRIGIYRPEQVLLLRRFDLWKLLSLRQFSFPRALKNTIKWPDKETREDVLAWFDNGRSKKELLELLKEKHVQPRALFKRTELQEQLQVMQKQLVW